VSRSPVFSRFHRRHGVVWLLVDLVVCQSALVSVLTTLGPSHKHETPAPSLVLEDVRRAISPASARLRHVMTALGHFHGAGPSERHYHPRTDGSVVLTDAGSTIDDDHDGALSAASAFVALLPAAHAWTAAESPSVIGRVAAWPSITDDPEPLERPPRQT